VFDSPRNHHQDLAKGLAGRSANFNKKNHFEQNGHNKKKYRKELHQPEESQVNREGDRRRSTVTVRRAPVQVNITFHHKELFGEVSLGPYKT